VTMHTMVNEQMQFFLRGVPAANAHPMAVMTGLVGALVGLLSRQQPTSINPEHRQISAVRLIAKMPTLVAMAYKYAAGPGRTSIR